MGSNVPTFNKMVLVALIVALAAILIASVVFRTAHPDLVVQTDHQHSEQDAMGDVSALMEQLRENPEDVNILSRLAISFSQMEAWERAASFWQRVLDQEPNNMRALQGMAMASFRMQDFETAVTYLQKALEQEPDSFRTHYNLAIVYKHFLEKPEKARSHFETVANSEEAPTELQEQARAELEQEQE
ncbi:MAG: tetratricopeptide repeat protein [Thermodesulfobacteriota bacterium]